MSISVFGNQQQSADPFASLATYQPESSESFAPYVAGDGVASSPLSSALGFGSSPAAGAGAAALGGGSLLGGSASPMASILGTIVQSIMAQLQSVMSLFSQLAGGAAGGSQSGSAVPAGYAPAGGSPTGSAAPQQYVSDATASSVGDPHDSFHGTMGDGSQLGAKWDSMRSHGNLLDSDSFSGGYRVSTVATAPNAKGVTLNGSANVSTDGGATNVSLSGDGSYSVTSGGQAVALQTGQATSLGNGESVTLNADKSLTISDANGSGGTLSTTLRTNGAGGVDVQNTAHDVDLGGYLVRHAEREEQQQSGSAAATAWNAGSGSLGFPVWQQQQQQLADPIDPAAIQLA